MEKEELEFCQWKTPISLQDLLFQEDEETEMEYMIPFFQQNLISVLNEKDNPYLIFEKFPLLEKKLDSLPQYGILSHNLNGAEYYHSHTRKIHSLDVAFLLERIAHNNGLSKRETIVLILIGLLHDIATPSRGDTAMKIFKDLKEEENFKTYLKHYPEFESYLQESFGITLDELAPYIKNEGTNGKLLDFADKIAYTLRDIERFVPTRSFAHIQDNPITDELQTLIEKNPHIGNVINDIRIDQATGTLYFEDAEKLYNLLLARAYMHNAIYLNPDVHSREHAVGLLIAFLLEEGELTKEQLLLGQKDGSILNDFFFIRYSEIDQTIPYNPLIFQEDFFEKGVFPTGEERQGFTNRLQENNPEYKDTIFHIKTPKFKSGSQFLINHHGEKIPLATARAGTEKLQKLENLAQQTEKYLILIPSREFLESKNRYPKFYDFLAKESQKSLSK